MDEIKVEKVLNNGMSTESKQIVNFLSATGYKTPKYIWVGKSKHGIEICGMTKKGCIASISRDNRLFKDGIEL